ncbi:MAG TPA: pilus assembly PilX N-terminal domain-containing protein, partial [Longimicrobium sp.]|nr:pilus assembly PilX N-terminal domain-containing protein [Longimicrobium sp.]
MHLNLTPRAPRLDRAGIALPLALLGLVIVSLLVTTALLTSSTEAAISNAHQDAVTSLYRADQAVGGFLALKMENQGTSTDLLREGDTVYAPVGGRPFNIRTTRLYRSPVTPTPAGQTISETYALVARPENGVGRSVGAMISTTRTAVGTELKVEAGASLASDEVKINGSIMLSGRQDLTKCATGSNVNAVDLASDVVADIKDSNVEGGSNEVQRSALNKAQYANYLLGGNTPAQLARIANQKFGFDGKAAFTGSPSSELPRTNSLNWGCPYQLVNCTLDGDENYFPVIAIQVPAGQTINPGGGHGQGILIVMGDLHLNSGFSFNGIVIVAGDLQVNGNAEIQGALMAMGDVTLDPANNARESGAETAELNGNALVRYNSC